MNRFQHAIPAGLIALVGLWVCFVSYTQTPAAAFAFPRLISTVFVVICPLDIFQRTERRRGSRRWFQPARDCPYRARSHPGLNLRILGRKVLWVLHRNHSCLLYFAHLV